MAFKASNVVPQEAYRIVRGAANQLRINLIAIKAQLAASGADYAYLKSIVRLLVNANNQFDTLKSTPGLAAYAQEQENDPTYDVAAEFTAMQSAITGAIAWMDANVPTSVTVGAPSTWGEGSIITNTFTAGQTAGLQTAIQSVIDEIS